MFVYCSQNLVVRQKRDASFARRIREPRENNRKFPEIDLSASTERGELRRKVSALLKVVARRERESAN